MSLFGGQVDGGPMSNTGFPYSMQQLGIPDRAILESMQAWDMDKRRKPIFEEWLPPSPAPDGGRLSYEGNVLIDPMGYSPLSEPEADPTMVSDFYAKTSWKAYTVKKGMNYNDMDRVHGHPELVNNRTRMVAEFNARARDIWTARFILKDPAALTMFNPSGEYNTFGLEYIPDNPADDAGFDILKMLDDVSSQVEYQGQTEGIAPTLIVGPLGEKAIKQNTKIEQLIKYWDRQFIVNPKGTAYLNFRGITIRKLVAGWKAGPAGQGNISRAAGTFQKATLSNRARRFLMEDPVDPTKEDAILIFGQIGNTRYSKTNPSFNNFGSGEGFVRGPVYDVIHGNWKMSLEHTFCPCVENPFNIVIIKNFCSSWQDLTKYPLPP